MIGRFLFKVIVFALIIAYFSFYDYNKGEHTIPLNESTSLSSLLLHEQLLVKELGLESKDNITEDMIDKLNLAHIKGTLTDITQVYDHIVLAKVKVTNVHHLNIKKDKIISIYFTGHLNDHNLPVINENYLWLIQEIKDEYSFYYVQGGQKGIILTE